MLEPVNDIRKRLTTDQRTLLHDLENAGFGVVYTGKGQTLRIQKDGRDYGYINSTVIRKGGIYGHRFDESDACPETLIDSINAQFGKPYGFMTGWFCHTDLKYGEPKKYLVITDIQMPGIGGIELLRKINELYRDTAVIIASGIDRTQRVIDAIRMGAYDYLVKPCELDVLELCVQRALERRTLLRNARRYKEDLENRNIELARQKTELERIQAQLVHSEKMASLGQLAAGVAHELNNPAGFIFSNMTILPKYVARVEEILLSYEQVSLNDSDAERIEAVKSKTDYENVLADLTSIAADSYNGAERIRDIVQNLRLFSRLDEAEFHFKEVLRIHPGATIGAANLRLVLEARSRNSAKH